eukprot:1194698-Prorocentrum_minimum.AAC.2
MSHLKLEGALIRLFVFREAAVELTAVVAEYMCEEGLGRMPKGVYSLRRGYTWRKFVRSQMFNGMSAAPPPALPPAPPQLQAKL